MVVGIGWAIGATNLPGAWYAGLQKPTFNPPNWVFAPTWTVLYVMIAVAGWRTSV
jgi:tryptophan-rich sensory protein